MNTPQPTQQHHDCQRDGCNHQCEEGRLCPSLRAQLDQDVRTLKLLSAVAVCIALALLATFITV